MTDGTREPGPGRPRVTSRAAIERAAITLFLAEGYERVTVDRIAAAGGVGRATFFRYFNSKADVVFYAFDSVLDQMRDFFADAPARQELDSVVVEGVLSSTREALTNPFWLDRFVLLESSATLRADAALRWDAWSGVVEDYLVLRVPDTDRIRLAAFAGAVRATYMAHFRQAETTQSDPATFVSRLERSLSGVCAAVRPLLLAEG